MPSPYRTPRLSRNGKHHATTPSPLRHASNISNNSADENNTRNAESHPANRPHNISSTPSQDLLHSATRKRGIRETSPTKTSASPDYQYMSNGRSPPRLDQVERPSLRPLPQGANVMSPPQTSSQPLKPSQIRERGGDSMFSSLDGTRSRPPEQAKPRQQNSIGLSRSDSRKAPTSDGRGRSRQNDGHNSSQGASLETSELEKLGRSATGHMRTLSKLTEQGVDEDFKIKSREQEVAGLHGRRRLQRGASQRDRTRAPGYGGRTWMDQQRQFLQAYEYLCHIGEAKEWIEDIISKPIPAIVQLEEALRDGVTLAEVVQSLHPQRTFRIFRNPKLQFRHSDNIAIFFKYLSEVELPDLFRFELVDLYEKKNIPKVIYCVHALSWLLFRKGIVNFRIGNLVGQLQFEDHELEEVQKGLDRAGISMPNFSGMSEKLGAPPEPEPEPQPRETEEERIERELDEHHDNMLDLQSQIRGAALRMKLGDSMQHMWGHEDLFLDLQARIRGDFARQISDYKLQMKHFAASLQSMARGYLIRSRERRKEQHWKTREKDVVKMQSLVRARMARAQTQTIKTKVTKHQQGIKDFQSAIRGALKRWQIGDQYAETRAVEPVVTKLQSSIQGLLKRRGFNDQLSDLHRHERQFVQVQGAVRGWLLRRQQQTHQQQVAKHYRTWTSLAAIARGHLAKREVRLTRACLHAEGEPVLGFQALVRGRAMRQRLAKQQHELRRDEPAILRLQSATRAAAVRKCNRELIAHLHRSTPSTITMQGFVRGSLARTRVFNLLEELNQYDSVITDLQATAKAEMIRQCIADDLEQLQDEESAITDLQASIRAMAVRAKFEEKKRFYQENMKRVVKIQSFVRGKQQGEAYKSLTAGKNPPIGTVKNFVHLLNDSDFDFDEEIESEKLQKTLLARVQANEQLEQFISDLDVKIGLLAQTKISSDEAVKMRRHHPAFAQVNSLDRHGSIRDSFNTKSLNRSSKAKIDRYGELLYYLQTQPQYFARLFRKGREHGTMSADSKRFENLIMGAFAFAQKRREEYLLLKLIARSMKEEIDGCASLEDFIRGNFFFTRLFGAYTKVPRDRKYVKQIFGQLFRAYFVDNIELDLESDPLQIYRALLNDDELRTGRRSHRPQDLPREEIIKDKEARSIYIEHLMQTRAIVGELLTSFEETIQHMPFGTRFLAQQMMEILVAKFPRAEEEHLLNVTGHWLWKHYFRAAMNEPESCGVVDRPLEPKQKRNLAQVAKVASQITLGRLFDDHDPYLGPLNECVQDGMGRWLGFVAEAMQIPPAESKFDISESNDLYARTKPTLYIKMSSVISIHELITNELSFICVSPEDNALRDVLRDLGNPKNNEAEMGAGSGEVTLTLGGRLHATHDPDAEIKNLFMETKRCVLYIIRIQAGSNLMDVLVKPITAEDEARWEALVHEELAADKRSSRLRTAYTEGGPHSNLTDIASLSYAELKSIALENIISLQQAGRLSQDNQYQDLLNEIAIDIRQKHRRRVQRQQELERTRINISHLEAKSIWLEERLRAYNDTFEHNLVTLQGKAKDKTKGKFIMPFSKQWHHQREMERLGREPRYGSYKRSAEHFLNKGILLSWEGRDLRSDDITISSDEINQFLIEGSSGSMMITGASDAFTWDDLLSAEYDGKDVLEFFKSAAEQIHGADALRRGGSMRREVLRLDTRSFKAWMSKKFFPDT